MSNYDKRKISEWTEDEKSGLRVLISTIGIIIYALFGAVGFILLLLKG